MGEFVDAEGAEHVTAWAGTLQTKDSRLLSTAADVHVQASSKTRIPDNVKHNIYTINSSRMDPVIQTSSGAHRTHRPLAFPLATRSTMEGWEQVTACTAVILLLSASLAMSCPYRHTKVGSSWYFHTIVHGSPCMCEHPGSDPCFQSNTSLVAVGSFQFMSIP